MSSTESKIEALVTADDLPQRLAAALLAGDRGRQARARVSPELSYGRHAGPAPHTARLAAVAVLLFRRADRWHLPLTERAVTLARHASQISLPGGAIDVAETSIVAALRELNEELGFAAPHLVVGRLADCYVFASDFLVMPWILSSFEPDTSWWPHDREVQSVVELPLDALLVEHNIRPITIERGPLKFQAPSIQFNNTIVWGATSVILAELREVLQQLTNRLI
jgi:8-oxo-dGTP pyrophosphatase MutT (NUDIX family)